MTYEELKAAYEAAVQKCSELEKENDELKKVERRSSSSHRASGRADTQTEQDALRTEKREIEIHLQRTNESGW